MTRAAKILLSVLLLTLLGCKSGSDRMKERQKAREAEKKAQEDAAEAKRKASEPKIDWAKLDEFWEPPGSVKISSGKPCPEGLWSLFPVTPGEAAEQQANEAKRESLLEKVKGQTYYVQLRHDQGVELKKYNAKKKTMTVEVEGLVECFDGAGLLSVAWGDPAKPFRPKDDDEDDSNPPQSGSARRMTTKTTATRRSRCGARSRCGSRFRSRARPKRRPSPKRTASAPSLDSCSRSASPTWTPSSRRR
jgi:hypothetical protein